MLDVLIPLQEFFSSQSGSHRSIQELRQPLLQLLVSASEESSNLRAKKGRARYLDGKEIG